MKEIEFTTKGRIKINETGIGGEGVIVALFVETGGCYYGIPDVDPWDIQRDARLYDGTDPVVAHPPCERWGRFAEGSPLKRGYKIGDDGGCFATALAAVRRCGGVLEHPSHSKAWDLFGLQKPRKGGGWTEAKHGGEWTCEVEQGHYGHRARKLTWILFVGPRPLDLIWGKSPQRLPQKRLAEKGYKAAVRCGGQHEPQAAAADTPRVPRRTSIPRPFRLQ